MDHPNYYSKTPYLDFDPQPPAEDSLRTAATYTIYALLALYSIHQVLVYYDYPLLPPGETLWNAIVYITPKYLLLDRARRQELKANGMLAQTHAAKSDALRRMLGLGGNAVLQTLPGEGIMRRMSGVGRRPVVSDVPPGLGNWDNSCYQNSVLQGLASLDSLKEYLGSSSVGDGHEEEGKGVSTTEALRMFVGSLNDEGNNGRHLWTPAKLKNMSSWQQQDAQEYYSKVLDELDKEATKAAKGREVMMGLESLAEDKTEAQKDELEEQQKSEVTVSKNPLEGLLAQRVACTQCGYSEGLSMIPFNCLTLPLGSNQPVFALEQCLNESTQLEEISSVDCAKCTLLRSENQLRNALPTPPNYRAVDAEPAVANSTLALPPELRAHAFQRLAKMQQALAEDDFADKTLHETCQISKKSKVSSNKTRQAVIGRAPQSLVLHVNRSVFDEMTGVQRKNYAGVAWPAMLDLSAWALPANGRDDLGPSESLLTNAPAAGSGQGEERLLYKIKAVVTHYGRHENGHYICYRQYPTRVRVEEELDGVDEDDQSDEEKDGAVEMRWWRLSDEDVTAVSEEEVLRQGGVFMLFYEREQMPELPESDAETTALATETADAAVPPIAPADVAEDPNLAESEAKAAVDTETEQIAEPATILPEPSHALSTLTETEPSSTNPTTPASVATDSTSPFDEEGISTEATTESESEVEAPDTPQIACKRPSSAAAETPTAPPATPPMRTARSSRPESSPGSTKKDGGFGVGGSGFRAMATT